LTFFGGQNADLVALVVTGEGRLHEKSQLLDYEKRGAALESYNFVSFITDTYEERFNSARSVTAPVQEGEPAG